MKIKRIILIVLIASTLVFFIFPFPFNMSDLLITNEGRYVQRTKVEYATLFEGVTNDRLNDWEVRVQTNLVMGNLFPHSGYESRVRQGGRMTMMPFESINSTRYKDYWITYYKVVDGSTLEVRTNADNNAITQVGNIPFDNLVNAANS
ncbi:hypothetical protein LCGC14_1454330 [marine sediment metagenome]|uniref:Uncharacterized protein n=1 Tax=marine sediment metagenome TaxID=412755 RepID=A0A0F9MIS1_9ZZZZ